MIRTNAQNKQLNALFSKIYPVGNREEAKASLAYEYSKKRTQKTSALTEEECDALIQALIKIDRSQRVIVDNNDPSKALKKMFALRAELKWSYERLSEFIIKQTEGKYYHTRQLDVETLNRLISVMEKIELDKLKKR